MDGKARSVKVCTRGTCVRLFGDPLYEITHLRLGSAYAPSTLTTTCISLIMSSTILDPSVLVSKLPNVLPPSTQSLQSQVEGLAALVHAAMSVLGFRLIAVDDSSSPRTFDNNVLPDEWNQHGPGSYTFRYRHDQSSLEFLLKVLKLGTRTVINAIAVEVGGVVFLLGAFAHVHLQTDKAATLDIPTNDFTSQSFFPHDLSATDASPLVHGFISSNRIADFMSQYQMMIVQKLIPGLRKDGYTEQVSDASTNAGPGPSQPSNPPAARPETIIPPYGPDRNSPLAMPPRNPLEIGRRDRDPFPRNPFAPPSLFPDDGDGMFVGPNHPIFSPSRGAHGELRGPWGGDGYLPPMGAPPGARFDPVGPGFGPHPGGPLPGGGGRGRGFPGPGNTGDPDPDELMPPGAVRNPFHPPTWSPFR